MICYLQSDFFEKYRLKGGERHPMPQIDLLQRSAKNDKRKTAKADAPLRFIDIIVLICGNLTSTFMV